MPLRDTASEWQGEKIKTQHGQVEGEDPQAPPGVKVSKVVLPALRVAKNSCDEESGEHEEEVNARPPGPRNQRNDLGDRALVAELPILRDVVQHDA
jgi:hypothetical protein